MLVQVFRHSEAHKQGEEPKFTGKLVQPIRGSQGYDVALIIKEDGSFVEEEFSKLVEAPAKALEQKAIAPAKKVISKTTKK